METLKIDATTGEVLEEVAEAVLGRRMTIEQMQAHQALLRQIVETVLVAGQDYGFVGNTNKRSLTKDGMEKLLLQFGCGIRIKDAKIAADFQANYISYTVTVQVVDIERDKLLCEKLGQCSTREKFHANKLKNGTEVFELANTILQVATKRAVLMAGLAALGAGGLFSADTDVEGHGDHYDQPQRQGNQRQQNSRGEYRQPYNGRASRA
jgi:hypothetical protein